MTTKAVWETYNIEIKNFILSKIQDKHIANDLLQEVFIKVHTKINTLRDIDKLKSWIFSITRNTLLDYFKSSKRTINTQKNNIEVLDESILLSDNHSEYDCLYGIIKNLPKKYRDPLFMADIKGMKQRSIANILKLPLPTVKSQIQRARRMIGQGFMDCCGFELNDKGFLVGEVKPKENCNVCN